MTAQFDRFAQLAAKMEAAAAAGDPNARQWLIELKTAILEFRQDHYQAVQQAQAPQRQGGGFMDTIGQGLTLGLGVGLGAEIVEGLFDW